MPEQANKTNKIIIADALEGLTGIERESVNMCVTSPPYFGLRDYGTAKWEGGNETCDHKGNALRTRKNINNNTKTGIDRKNTECTMPFKNVCGKCGAVRRDKQIGLEETPEEYIEKLVCVFREVKRVLRDDGTLWLNIGDTYNAYKGNANSDTNGSKYAGFRNQPARKSKYGLECKNLKPKDLIGIPWRLAFALQEDGWYLRQDIIWAKPNPMPESVTDRCTKSHEYIFLLSKSGRYYYDNAAIKEIAVTSDNHVRDRDGTRLNNTPGRTRISGLTRNNYSTRNKRDVWFMNTKPYKGAHFAVYPPELARNCILAGSRKDDVVLDPFIGSGTTAVVALEEERKYIGIELNPAYAAIAEKRINQIAVQLKIF